MLLLARYARSAAIIYALGSAHEKFGVLNNYQFSRSKGEIPG